MSEHFTRHWPRLQARWAEVQAHLGGKTPDAKTHALIVEAQQRMGALVADPEAAEHEEGNAVYRLLGRVLKALEGMEEQSVTDAEVGRGEDVLGAL